MNENLREPRHSVMSDNDSQLFNEFRHNVFHTASKQGIGARQLSKYTAIGLHSTCMGLVDLTRHILEEKKSNTFVSYMYGYTMLDMEPTPRFWTGEDWRLQEIPFASSVFSALLFCDVHHQQGDVRHLWHTSPRSMHITKIKACVCRKSLMGVFQNISDHYNFSDHKWHCRTLINILINVFCKKIDPRSSREAKQKLIKLSSWIFYWPVKDNIVCDFIDWIYFMFKLTMLTMFSLFTIHLTKLHLKFFFTHS